MIRLLFSANAEDDLTDLALTIAADNARAAVAFVHDIRRHCAMLAVTPYMGRPRADIGPDVRSFAHPPYVIYYRPRESLDFVEVLRIWHGRRRTPRAADLR